MLLQCKQCQDSPLQGRIKHGKGSFPALPSNRGQNAEEAWEEQQSLSEGGEQLIHPSQIPTKCLKAKESGACRAPSKMPGVALLLSKLSKRAPGPQLRGVIQYLRPAN